MKKVTGIGGIFFKCKEPNKMKEWYKSHLGMDVGPYGASFEWYEDAEGKKKEGPAVGDLLHHVFSLGGAR